MVGLVASDDPLAAHLGTHFIFEGNLTAAHVEDRNGGGFGASPFMVGVTPGFLRY